MKKTKTLKIMYIVAIVVIIAGIVATCVWKTNFSLLYDEHKRIDVYLGKDYNIEDIKQITSDVFAGEKVVIQEIETFHDSLAINVKQVNDEQLNSLKEKIKTKYEIEEIDDAIVSTTIPHYRIRNIIKPYIIPMLITTLIILAYVAIRYLNLGMFKVVFTLLLRLIVLEAVFVSIIEIVRIPVGVYTIPFGILVYILVTILTVVGYENEITKRKEKEKKK
ncbi:MAG: hypothetical protein J6A04_06680 [Clostridia bacterium]|nr:hypothetical protein [Clostridia bacterium]